MVSISNTFQQPEVSKEKAKSNINDNNQILQEPKFKLVTNDSLKLNYGTNNSVLPVLSIPDNDTFISLKGLSRDDLESTIKRFFPDARITSVSEPDVYSKFISFESKGKPYELRFVHLTSCFGPTTSTTTIKDVKPEVKTGYYPPLTDPKDIFKEINKIPRTAPEEFDINQNSKKNFEISGSIEKGFNIKFPMGFSPGYEPVIRDIFGERANIKLGPVKISHPFAQMDFEVDGKKYQVHELVGGFAPSSGFTIIPMEY